MKLLLPLAIAVASIAVPAATVAADGPSAGCPASKVLDTVVGTRDRVDKRIYDEAGWAALLVLLDGLDKSGNGDGYLCSKQLKPNQGQDKQWGADDYPITQIWDNQPTGRSIVVP